MENHEVDFNFFIQSTIQKNIPWKSLASLLIHLAPTPKKSKQVIEILVQELELWVAKVESDQINAFEKPTKNEVDCVKHLEKTDSEDESFSTDTEISNDKRLLDIDEFQSVFETNTDNYINGTEYMDEKSKELVHETSLENDQDNNLQSIENKLDYVASKFYEFVGSNDISKDEIETVDTGKTVKNETKSSIVMENEEANIVMIRNKHGTESPSFPNFGEKKNQCNICDRSFKNPSEKAKHEIVHTEDRPFSCDLCSKAFKERRHLETHKIIHSGEKPHQCKTCAKSFNRISNLKRHSTIHMDEKPFPCKTCKKSFSDSSNLKVHERIHSGEKSFLCKTCNKSYYYLRSLIEHKRVHTGEKLFQCKTCHKSFSVSSSLKRHERVHTGEKLLKDHEKNHTCLQTLSENLS